MTRASQRWDPAEYARSARFVSDLGAEVLALLDPAPGERILDLGGGDGALSERIARAGAEVVALDSSAEQVAAAADDHDAVVTVEFSSACPAVGRRWTVRQFWQSVVAEEGRGEVTGEGRVNG